MPIQTKNMVTPAANPISIPKTISSASSRATLPTVPELSTSGFGKPPIHDESKSAKVGSYSEKTNVDPSIIAKSTSHAPSRSNSSWDSSSAPFTSPTGAASITPTEFVFKQPDKFPKRGV